MQTSIRSVVLLFSIAHPPKLRTCIELNNGYVSNVDFVDGTFMLLFRLTVQRNLLVMLCSLL